MGINARPKRPAVGTEQYPAWMLKLVRRKMQLENNYKKAHTQFASIYNEFLLMIEEINMEYGTSFTFQQAMQEFGGEEALDDEDEDDEDED